jgi:tripartite-type tricarboxylate transporter receptor subunit TctC
MQDPRFNRRQLLGSGLALAGLSALPAQAQTPAWPAAKPIRLIVNFPAGGSPDAVALLNNKMPYDPAKDLIPVAAGARLELFLVVRADAPYKTYAEFIAHAKRNPGKLSYGSPGNGTSPHIAGEMLKSQAGIFTVHIPYRGSAAVLQDLLAGSLDYTFDPGIAFSHVRSGRLRLLAVGSVKRTPMFPDAPTLIELGLAGFDAGTTHGFWAPAGTPPDIVDRMNREINRALGTQPVIDVIRSLGAEPQPITPRQFSEVIRADMARYAKIIQERKITQD